MSCPRESLTTLLPGRPDPGRALDTSAVADVTQVPAGAGVTRRSIAAQPGLAQLLFRRDATTGATTGVAAVVPGVAPTASVTVFLIDRPGPRGDLARAAGLISGAQAPAEASAAAGAEPGGHSGARCLFAQGESAAPVVRAVPTWGLSRFTPCGRCPLRRAAVRGNLADASGWQRSRRVVDPSSAAVNVAAGGARGVDSGGDVFGTSAWSRLTITAMADPRCVCSCWMKGPFYPNARLALPVSSPLLDAARR